MAGGHKSPPKRCPPKGCQRQLPHLLMPMSMAASPQAPDSHGVKNWHSNLWVWVKIESPGDRRFWSFFPITRVPFALFLTHSPMCNPDLTKAVTNSGKKLLQTSNSIAGADFCSKFPCERKLTHKCMVGVPLITSLITATGTPGTGSIPFSVNLTMQPHFGEPGIRDMGAICLPWGALRAVSRVEDMGRPVPVGLWDPSEPTPSPCFPPLYMYMYIYIYTWACLRIRNYYPPPRKNKIK